MDDELAIEPFREVKELAGPTEDGVLILFQARLDVFMNACHWV
jgi:hypothetical protein